MWLHIVCECRKVVYALQHVLWLLPTMNWNAESPDGNPSCSPRGAGKAETYILSRLNFTRGVKIWYGCFVWIPTVVLLEEVLTEIFIPIPIHPSLMPFLIEFLLCGIDGNDQLVKIYPACRWLWSVTATVVDNQLVYQPVGHQGQGPYEVRKVMCGSVLNRQTLLCVYMCVLVC